jgi:hypothetical protein
MYVIYPLRHEKFSSKLTSCRAFFFLSALIEMALIRYYRKEKAFGPSPGNNYTAGSTPQRIRFWQRRDRDATLASGGLAATEKRHPDSLPIHSTPEDVRNSYNTENTAVGAEVPYNKYGTGAGDEYNTSNAGYRNSEYPTTATSAAGGRDNYQGAGTNTAAYDNAYPATATTTVHDSGYRMPATGTTYQSHFMQPGEIPAREYVNNPSY